MSSKDHKLVFAGLIIYFWWNLWKARNRRTFQHEEKMVPEVVNIIKEDFHPYRQAPEVASGNTTTSVI